VQQSERRAHDAALAEAGVEAAVGPVAGEHEAERVPAVALSRDDDAAIALHGDRARELEAAELGVYPAPLTEGRI
jgi:hypothetical protein